MCLQGGDWLRQVGKGLQRGLRTGLTRKKNKLFFEVGAFPAVLEAAPCSVLGVTLSAGRPCVQDGMQASSLQSLH